MMSSGLETEMSNQELSSLMSYLISLPEGLGQNAMFLLNNCPYHRTIRIYLNGLL